jgi:hypothetical protein
MRRALGIMTVLGALDGLGPSAASAQAIGTLQVEARVTAAEFEWSSLQAAQQLAGRAYAVTDPESESRLALPLSEVNVVAPASRMDGDDRLVLIAVQYLRN